jgi:hypothetical protein
MKCYVSNGNLKFVVESSSHDNAAFKAIISWSKSHPQVIGARLTRVSELGFDFDAEGHDQDSIFCTQHLVS